MKVFELLEINKESIKALKKAGVMLHDIEYMDMYFEYIEMINHGEKVTYVVALMSEKYKISIRQVYTLIKRLGSDCKINTV